MLQKIIFAGILTSFLPFKGQETLKDSLNNEKNIDLVVMTGTMRNIKRSESPVPVEVYGASFLKKNPTHNVFDALQNINGVKPQINCSVCNTGDIRINGMDGTYTMVMIDGMPMVSSLGSVYGFSGIPNALIDKIEIVKGPASTLYGSEAMGGLINIITKNPKSAPVFHSDMSTTSWGERNTDLTLKFNLGKKVNVLTGLNYFNFQNTIDKNQDNFTDMSLQDRISIFQKWNFQRENNKIFNLAGRFLYEDRWGGETQWNKKFRGSDEIYAESIYTNRQEIFTNYQLPTQEKILFMGSFINHEQNSFYGNRPYIGGQKIAFGQFVWDKKTKKHHLTTGVSIRYTDYKAQIGGEDLDGNITIFNDVQKIWLPGIFVEDEISLSPKQQLLLGIRYDYNLNHGSILAPRIAYKSKFSDDSIFRLNAGTGYRVANIFTEEHEAMTGGRTIIIDKNIKPERSYSLNANYMKKIYLMSGTFLNFDLTGFYTFINNSIHPQYESNILRYANNNTFAQNKGITFNFDANFPMGLGLNLGATLMDYTKKENGETKRIEFSERFSTTWGISYKIRPINLNIDYTGNLYSPMKLPLLEGKYTQDPRLEYSPWYSIQNIQLTYTGIKNFEIYGGIKNILNHLPTKGNPFIIARSNDPFDKNISKDSEGNILATPNNPYGLSFDPSYAYSPNQGIRFFLGIRYNLKS